MTTDEKAWIDNASYEDLLGRWRFAESGSAWFQGATGQYYSDQMAKKRAETQDNGVSASKRIGWER